jgi:hypothetical protein
MASGNSIQIPSGIGSATCSTSVAVWNNAGTAGISGTNIGKLFDKMAGDSSEAAGGDAPIASGSPSTSSLTLTLGEGDISRGAVTIDGSNGSMASSDSIPIPSGAGSATCPKSMAVPNNAGTTSIDIGEAFDKTAGDSSEAAGEDASIDSGSPLTSSLTLTSGEGDTSGGAVTTDGSDGSMASGDTIPIPLDVGSATCSKSVAIWNDTGTADISSTDI